MVTARQLRRVRQFIRMLRNVWRRQRVTRRAIARPRSRLGRGTQLGMMMTRPIVPCPDSGCVTLRLPARAMPRSVRKSS